MVQHIEEPTDDAAPAVAEEQRGPLGVVRQLYFGDSPTQAPRDASDREVVATSSTANTVFMPADVSPPATASNAQPREATASPASAQLRQATDAAHTSRFTSPASLRRQLAGTVLGLLHGPLHGTSAWPTATGSFTSAAPPAITSSPPAPPAAAAAAAGAAASAQPSSQDERPVAAPVSTLLLPVSHPSPDTLSPEAARTAEHEAGDVLPSSSGHAGVSEPDATTLVAAAALPPASYPLESPILISPAVQDRSPARPASEPPAFNAFPMPFSSTAAASTPAFAFGGGTTAVPQPSEDPPSSGMTLPMPPSWRTTLLGGVDATSISTPSAADVPMPTPPPLPPVQRTGSHHDDDSGVNSRLSPLSPLPQPSSASNPDDVADVQSQAAEAVVVAGSDMAVVPVGEAVETELSVLPAESRPLLLASEQDGTNAAGILNDEPGDQVAGTSASAPADIANLQTGDVVMLVQQGRAYAVVHAPLPFKESSLQYVLDLLPYAGAPAPQDEPRCWLEVVRQGTFFGFRSPLASQRFLQPRRRAPHRLVFFNPNCGVWEQWEATVVTPSAATSAAAVADRPLSAGGDMAAAGGTEGAAPAGQHGDRRSTVSGTADADGAGSASQSSGWPRGAGGRQLLVLLRNRQLPQAQLQVQVLHRRATRDGGGSSSLGSTARWPRYASSVTSEEVHEDENLRRISSVLLKEWFRFVDVEKQQRLVVEAQMSGLVQEAADLRMTTLGQVEYLREEVNAELSALYTAMRQRDSAVAGGRERLQRALSSAVAILAARRNMHQLRCLLTGWRDVAWCSVRRRLLYLRLVSLLSSRVLGRVFHHWAQCCRDRQLLGTLLIRAVESSSRRRMALALDALRHAAATRQQMRHTLLGAVVRLAHRRLALAFNAWQNLVGQHLAGRRALDLIASRTSSSVMCDALRNWQMALLLSRQRAHQALLLMCRREATLAVGVLQAWREVGSVRRERDGQCATYFCRGLQHRALTAWRHRATTQRRWKESAGHLQQNHSSTLQRSAFQLWQQQAQVSASAADVATSRLLQRQLTDVAAAWDGWRDAARQIRRRRDVVRRALSRRLLSTASSAWAAWRDVMQHRQWRQSRVVAVQRNRVHAVFALLHDHVALGQARRNLHRRCAAHVRRATLSSAMRGWSLVVLDRRAAAELLAAAAGRWMRGNLAASFRAWHATSRAAVDHRHAAVFRLEPATKFALSRLLEPLLGAPLMEDLSTTANSYPSFKDNAPNRHSPHDLSASQGGSEVSAHELPGSSGNTVLCDVVIQTGGTEQYKSDSVGSTPAVHMHQWVLATFLSHWWDVVSRRRLAGRRLQELWRRWGARSVRCAFDEWLAEARTLQAARAAAMALVARADAHLLRSAFSSWAQHAAHSADLRFVRGQRVDQKLQHGDAALLAAAFTSWAALCEARAEAVCQSAASLASRRHARTLLCAWEGWWDVVVRWRDARWLAVRAVMRMSRVREAQAFAAWRVEISLRRADSARLTKASRRRQRTVLAAWRRVVHEGQDLGQAARCAVDALRMRQVLAAWRLWRQEAWDDLVREASGTRRALTWQSRRTSLLVLCTWHQWAAAQQQRRAFIQRYHDRRVAAAAVRGWRAFAAYSSHLRVAAGRLTSRTRHSSLSAAFDALASATVAMVARRRHAATLAAKRDGRLLRDGFAAWALEAASWAARRDEAEARCVESWRRCLASCFGMWRRLTMAGALVALIGGRTAARRVEAIVARSWAAWWSYAVDCTARRAWAERQYGLQAGRTLGTALLAWAAYASDSRRRQAIAGELLGRRDRRSVVRCFQAWRDGTAGVAGRRAVAEELWARGRSRDLQGCFAAWVGLARDGSARGVATMDIARRNHSRLLAACLAGWRDVGQRAEAGRQAAVRVLSHMAQPRVRQAFTAWHTNSAARAARCRLLLRHIDNTASGHLRAAVAVWRDLLARRHHALQLMRFLLNHRTRIRLVRCLAAWRDIARATADRAEVAADIGEARLRRGAAAALAAWRTASAAAAARRLALSRHAVMRGRATQRSVLQAWCGAVVEARARTEALKTCIKRKRIAFQQFKQWYWDSFGADVQDTIRRMFHSTDAAVTSPMPSTRKPTRSSVLDGQDEPPSVSSSGQYNMQYNGHYNGLYEAQPGAGPSYHDDRQHHRLGEDGRDADAQAGRALPAPYLAHHSGKATPREEGADDDASSSLSSVTASDDDVAQGAVRYPDPHALLSQAPASTSRQLHPTFQQLQQARSTHSPTLDHMAHYNSTGGQGSGGRGALRAGHLAGGSGTVAQSANGLPGNQVPVTGHRRSADPPSWRDLQGARGSSGNDADLYCGGAAAATSPVPRHPDPRSHRLSPPLVGVSDSQLTGLSRAAHPAAALARPGCPTNLSLSGPLHPAPSFMTWRQAGEALYRPSLSLTEMTADSAVPWETQSMSCLGGNGRDQPRMSPTARRGTLSHGGGTSVAVGGRTGVVLPVTRMSSDFVRGVPANSVPQVSWRSVTHNDLFESND